MHDSDWVERLVDFSLALSKVLIDSLHMFASLDVRFIFLSKFFINDFKFSNLFSLSSSSFFVSWVMCRLFMMLFVEVFGLMLMHHLFFVLKFHCFFGFKLFMIYRLFVVLGLMSFFLVMTFRGDFVVYFVMGFMVSLDLTLSKVYFLAWLNLLDNFSILLMINLASLVVFHIGRQMFTVGELHFTINHLWFWLLNWVNLFFVMMFFLMVLFMNGFSVMLLFLLLLNHPSVLLMMFTLVLFMTFLMVMLFDRLLDMFLIKHVLLDMLFLIRFDHIVNIVQVLRVHQRWFLHERGFTLVRSGIAGRISRNIFDKGCIRSMILLTKGLIGGRI